MTENVIPKFYKTPSHSINVKYTWWFKSDNIQHKITHTMEESQQSQSWNFVERKLVNQIVFKCQGKSSANGLSKQTS